MLGHRGRVYVQCCQPERRVAISTFFQLEFPMSVGRPRLAQTVCIRARTVPSNTLSLSRTIARARVRRS